MPMPAIPDCAITLYFYEGEPATQGNPATPPRFSYCCTHSARGWQVERDGSIHPPSRSKIVQIALRGFPPGSGVSFAGLQISPDPDFPKEGNNWVVDPGSLGVTVETPDTYPPAGGTTIGPLRLTFADTPLRLFYRLAVQDGNGIVHWDDPKIYDDGSQ